MFAVLRVVMQGLFGEAQRTGSRLQELKLHVWNYTSSPSLASGLQVVAAWLQQVSCLHLSTNQNHAFLAALPIAANSCPKAPCVNRIAFNPVWEVGGARDQAAATDLPDEVLAASLSTSANSC